MAEGGEAYARRGLTGCERHEAREWNVGRSQKKEGKGRRSDDDF